MKVKVVVIAALTGLFAASISMADVNSSTNNDSSNTMSASASTDAMANSGQNDGAKQDDVSKEIGQSED